MMKKLLVVGLVALAPLALTGCGTQNEPTPPDVTPEEVSVSGGDEVIIDVDQPEVNVDVNQPTEIVEEISTGDVPTENVETVVLNEGNGENVELTQEIPVVIEDPAVQ